MIPWWNKRVEDETGKAGRVVDGFPFLSRFHPDAMNNVRLITELTGAKIVTNSTHNGGWSGTEGKYHIDALFRANDMYDLLYNETIPYSSEWPPYMSGFKNKALHDWKARKDRALGIRAWFTSFGKTSPGTPFIAIDDDTEDFRINNSRSSIKIPFVETLTTSDGLDTLNEANALEAIKIIKAHPYYTGKI